MSSVSTSTLSRKRPPPSLLPAFEPSSSASSSPALPRPAKRQARHSPARRDLDAYTKYPSPLPTSATGILSSSPPRVSAARPALRRTQSVVSERAPLCAVQSVTLSPNGDTLRMGRSSNSSHYQLSANRLISRVHVEARYVAARDLLEPNKIEIVCTGWNGLQLHCQGQTWELAKGDSFTSETEGSEIMLDAQDARVRILWPVAESRGSFHAARSLADTSLWEDDGSPSAGRGRSARSAKVLALQSSSLRQSPRMRSPESPTPVGAPIASSILESLLPTSQTLVQVYEDEESSKGSSENLDAPSSSPLAAAATLLPLESSQSDLSEPEHDPDEENDPVVHSFGPFGANIAARMASISTGPSSEQQARDASPSLSSADSDSTNAADASPIVNHVINQLAYSRLSSTPLSVIMNALPTSLKRVSAEDVENKGLTLLELQKLLNRATCIGEIHREGKDAAGKKLESEYYYIPDGDTDEQRRAAVVDGLRKPSLRACRKQHKVCQLFVGVCVTDSCSNTTGNDRVRLERQEESGTGSHCTTTTSASQKHHFILCKSSRPSPAVVEVSCVRASFRRLFRGIHGRHLRAFKASLERGLVRKVTLLNFKSTLYTSNSLCVCSL